VSLVTFVNLQHTAEDAKAPTRRERLRKELDFGSGDQTGLDPFDLVRHRRQLAIRMRLIGADGHYRQSRSLPQILVLDFGDCDVELLDPIFDASDDHALVFQRMGPGNVKLDSQ
jgi:hypothetical protein